MPYRKGLVLSWGLLNVIVSIDGAVGKEDSLTTVCCGRPGEPEHAPVQIAQVRKCSTCTERDTANGVLDAGIVAYSDLKKARKIGNEFQVADQQEVASVKETTLGATKKLLTLTVHDAVEFDARMLQSDGVYYVAPDGPAQVGPYSLLLDALKRRPDKRIVTRFTPTSAASTWVLRAFNDRIVIEKRCDPEQVKAAPAFDTVEPDAGLQAQLDQLLDAQTVPFDPATYRNEYALALESLLSSKDSVEGVATERTKTEKSVTTSGVVDLSATLTAMLGGGASTPVVAAVPDAPKAAPKKRAPKKAAEPKVDAA